MGTLHYEDTQAEIHKVVVGPVDNNVFVLRCKQTGDAALIDAANEHDRLLELCRALNVRQVIETHGHWDHIQAVPQLRDAGYSVGVTAADADMLPSYDEVIDDDAVVGRRPAPPPHDPHAGAHARLDVLPPRGLAGAVQRGHVVPRRTRRHQVPRR